jgi:LPS-assembly protein
VKQPIKILAILGLAGFLAAPVFGQEQPGREPTAPRNSATAPELLFKADAVDHERELGLVVARGNVEFVHGTRILRADTVNYNQKEDIVTATGNVALMEGTGEVIFADHAELSGDLKDGVVENIRVLLSDNARIAAVGGRRIGGNVLEMRKAVYSPCQKCIGNKPIWQVTAARIVHNKTAQEVEYRDAFLEFAGIPIFYTPYFSHPDPTVKRQSGFLTPSFGNDLNLGFVLETPYYFAISPDKDATFRPIITSDAGTVIAGEYRQRFAHGLIKAEASGLIKAEASGTIGSNTNDRSTERGHFFTNAQFDINPTWRTGADIALTSDDTYLQRYGLSSADTLTNHLFVEGFREDSYAVAQAYHWRGLRLEDDSGNTPIVAPTFDFNAYSEPGVAGGRWRVDANALVLTRTSGTDSRRLSLTTGWELPHIARTGEIYHLYADLQTDAYFSSRVQVPGSAAGDLSSGFSGRAFPRIGLDWRFPFARSGGPLTQILEPVAGIMLAPNGGNPGKISNEDSQDLEFDDTNLLSRNRFTGLDRVEGGKRVYYGLQMAVYGTNGYTDAFIGQSYRLRRDSTFDQRSGLDDHFSDIVGRVNIRPSAPVNLQYRFRLDKDGFSNSRSELSGSIGPRAFNVNVDYGFFDESSGSGEFSNREEIALGFTSQVTPEWSIGASTRRDLEAAEALSHQLFLEYKCDCFTARIDFSRSFTQDRDIPPTDSFFIRLIFETLGSLQTGTLATNNTLAGQLLQNTLAGQLLQR